MKLIHISDIHIHSEPILGFDPIDHFQQCIRHVLKHHADADSVVITGDLTHHGQRGSYLRLREMIEGWGMAPVLMIGNHDNREVFQDVFPETPSDRHGFVQYVQDMPAGRCIYLDTVKEGTHAGHFGKKRQKWLRDQLSQAALERLPVYLFMHHNPCEVGVHNADKIGLVDGPAFRKIVSKFQKSIRHIFFGHCHYILSGSVCGVPFSAPRSTNHVCVPEFTGADRMGVAPLPPTYNVCLLSEDSTVVHSIDFTEDDKTVWIETASNGWIKEDENN